jgi:hypothetical protein
MSIPPKGDIFRREVLPFEFVMGHFGSRGLMRNDPRERHLLFLQQAHFKR